MANGSQEQWRENLNMQMICKDCREIPPNLIEEFSNGDVVCGSCGLVLGERTVDTRSEWRTFANDDQGNDDPSRVGEAANPLLIGAQLETHIAYDKGANARNRDLHRAQGKATHDKNNKTLAAVYRELGDLCNSMDFTDDVANYARFLYKQIYDAGAFKGKSPEAMNAALIFIACRQRGVPRTFKEIQAFTKVQKADIGRMFKGLEKFFSNQNLKNQIAKEGNGKSTVSVSLILSLLIPSKGLLIHKRRIPPHNRLTPRPTVIDFAISSVYRSESLRFLRRLPYTQTN